MPTPPHILHPDAILPMTGQLRLDHAIAIHAGRILAIAPAATLRAAHPAATYQRLPGILLPALINAHTHLELSYLRQLATPFPPTSAPESPAARFVRWVTHMFTLAPAAENLPAIIATAARDGASQSLRHGVTTIGDISRNCALSRAALAPGPLRITSFGEVIGIGTMRNSHPHQFPSALAPTQSANVTAALSPHATYTVETPLLETLVQAATAQHLPLTMHLAEFAEESDFLRDHSGPLGTGWPLLHSLIDAATPTFPGGPIAWAKSAGLLDAPVPVLLAHVNYASYSDLDLLAASRAAVIYCPRTRTFFGHDAISPHPWQAMLARGINVCLGTDSLASNPDLNPLAEARHVLHLFPDANPLTLLEMITTRPARALGLANELGQLRPGLLADFVLFPTVPHPTAAATARALIESLPAPASVWSAGVEVAA